MITVQIFPRDYISLDLPSASLPPTRLPFTMLLVHKPPALLPSQSPLYLHTRHPSAPPAVVVHPTRTPGLLTLSKPPRPPLPRQNQRQAPKPLQKPKSTQLNLPAEITDSKKSGPATPSPQQRGRGQIKHTKDTVQIQR